jgi:hypothetical protein
MTVLQLKVEVERITGLEFCRQRLVCGGRQLNNDSQSLKAALSINGSVVHVFKRKAAHPKPYQDFAKDIRDAEERAHIVLTSETHLERLRLGQETAAFNRAIRKAAKQESKADAKRALAEAKRQKLDQRDHTKLSVYRSSTPPGPPLPHATSLTTENEPTDTVTLYLMMKARDSLAARLAAANS